MGTMFAEHPISTNWQRGDRSFRGRVAKPPFADHPEHQCCSDITQSRPKPLAIRVAAKRLALTKTVGRSTSERTATTLPGFQKSFIWVFPPILALGKMARMTPHRRTNRSRALVRNPRRQEQGKRSKTILKGLKKEPPGAIGSRWWKLTAMT